MDTSKISTFQLIVLVGLGFAAFVGLVAFALYRPSSQIDARVVIWGTLPATQVTMLLQQPAMQTLLTKERIAVSYVQKEENVVDQELIEALALGTGPDAIILRQDQILQYQRWITPIPYTSMPLRTYRDTFIAAADVYLQLDGVVALPFMIDPMVMYYNRDLLTNANIATAPQYWSDVLAILSRVTVADVQRVITRSAIALGTYDNVMHAKEIISLLLLQAGAPMVGQNTTGAYVVQMTSGQNITYNPGDRALTFYTQFADPLKSTYTWNNALPNSRDAFIANRVALYLGFASEYGTLQERNPNLNYDVTVVPQIDSEQTKVTYGNMYGIAILRNTPNMQSTFTTISALASPSVQAVWSAITGLPPVTRSLLSQTPTDSSSVVFYTAALQSRSWLDPKRSESTDIFSQAIRSINAGAMRPIEAAKFIEDAIKRLLP